MYFKVPIVDGAFDLDYNYLAHAVCISSTEVYVQLRNGFIPRDSWQTLTEEDWLSVQPVEEPYVAKETVEEKLARLEEQNLILMDALATTFEELLAIRTLVEGGTA